MTLYLGAPEHVIAVESFVNIFFVGREGRCFLVSNRCVAAATYGRILGARRNRGRHPALISIGVTRDLHGNAEPEFFALEMNTRSPSA